ncbi:hypothetical protein OAG85_01940 [Verrucomicrobiales bacterium]|nr:hypothetical protein [Verrucomicrobiales bacterium]
MLFAVTTWQNSALCCFAASLLVNTETVYSQTLVEAGIDTRRDRAYVKVEAESARVIDRSNKAHPAFDAGNTEGPGLHYEVLGPKVVAPRKMPAGASGDKALFNVGTGEQTEVEGQRNSVYKPHEAPPLGTIAEYRVRFRQAGVYELFLRLAYWSESETKPDLGLHWAAHSNANGIGAIHVKDYASGRLLNSDLETRKQEIAKLTNDIGDLTKAKSEVEKELKSSIDALQKAREEASKLKSHLDQSEKSKSDLQKKIDELQKALEEKEAEAEKANETEEAAKEEVSALDRQNTQLKSSLTKSQVALTEFKKVIDQAQPVQQDNTVASAAALREEDLLQQLKQERQDRQEITEFLKQLQRKVRQIQGELVDAQSANL